MPALRCTFTLPTTFQLPSRIYRCKQNQKSAIDACKKSRRLTPWLCEAGRINIPICEANRINVPLCELDRATAGCCESSRGFAKQQCSISGPANVQTLIQTFQVACSVATSVAKSALKSYATGAVLGFVSDVAQIQEVVETVQKVSVQLSAEGARMLHPGVLSLKTCVCACVDAACVQAAALNATLFVQCS